MDGILQILESNAKTSYSYDPHVNKRHKYNAYTKNVITSHYLIVDQKVKSMNWVTDFT